MRDSRFELGRIISMLLIVIFHVAVVIPDLRDLSFCEKSFLYSIGSWGILGVNYFVLLTAYFASRTSYYFDRPTHKTLMRLGKLISQSYVYIFVALALLFLLGKICVKGILSHALFAPLFMDTYWFVWAYVGLILLQPILEKILAFRNRYQFGLICVLIVLLNTYPSHSRTPTDILWFVLIYMFYRYIFENKSVYATISKNAVVGFATLTIFITICLLVEDYCLLNFKSQYKILDTYINVKRYSLLLVVDAVFFFAMFEKMKCFHNKVVNRFATSMFGIYLFHNCNYLDLRTIIPMHYICYYSCISTLFISTIILCVGGYL